MILSIILLILIVLLLSIIILFSFYVFLPSVQKDNSKLEDPIINPSQKTYVLPEEKIFDKSDTRALVMCSSKKEFTLHRSVFNKEYTCFMAKSAFGSGQDCKFACIGLGDCIKVCPQKAIYIVNNTAVISNNCCGCGKCIEVCPQNLIKMVPTDTQSIVLCNHTTSEMTSCTKHKAEEKVKWETKKDFKFWYYCYKIVRKLTK